ncbi:MAG: hypothetical protein JO056_09930 [Alphaproteobacteria bacterium]|nr:hypothetical protein [Alphaproteobacteria bacterium]
MDSTIAGGQITQHPSPGVISLELDLHNAADAIAALLTDARAIDSGQDEFGHARGRCYSEAVALLKASAKVGHTIAELRGSKFEHNINVRRQTIAEPDSCDAFNADPLYQGCTYDPSATLRDGRVFVRGKGWMHVPGNWDEGRWRAGLPQNGEGDTPRISGGSNGNFGHQPEPGAE